MHEGIVLSSWNYAKYFFPVCKFSIQFFWNLILQFFIFQSLLGQPDGSLSMLQNTSKLSSGDLRLEETKSAMSQLQAEFNNYKKEKCENERYSR